MTRNEIALIALGLCILGIGFVAGWLFPMEGPYDYVYDEMVKEKRPSVNAPPKENKPLVIIDEEDEPELIYILPELPTIGE